MAAYNSFGISASHLLSASVMSAPAALAFAKLFYPETKKSKTTADNLAFNQSKLEYLILVYISILTSIQQMLCRWGCKCARCSCQQSLSVRIPCWQHCWRSDCVLGICCIPQWFTRLVWRSLGCSFPIFWISAGMDFLPSSVHNGYSLRQDRRSKRILILNLTQ